MIKQSDFLLIFFFIILYSDFVPDLLDKND